MASFSGANKQAYGFWPVKDMAPQLRRVDVTAAFVKGDPLIIDGSTPPRLELCTSGGAFIDAIATCSSSGLADNDQVPVLICGEKDEFYCRADGDTTNLGEGSEIDITGATGAVVADVSESTTNVLIVVNGKPNPDDVQATAGATLTVRMYQRSRS